MDNATHTLIGLAVASSLGKKLEPRDRGAWVWAAVLGSNLPDGDAVTTWVMRALGKNPSPLDGLLNHRAETHTLLFALPASFLLSGLISKLFGRPWGWKLWGVSLLSILLHLFADSWNNYGVHPLSPFSGRLYSQDFIFILEPLLFFALWPWAWHLSGKWKVKGFWAFIAGLVLFAAAQVPGIPGAVRVFIFFWAAGMFFLHWGRLRAPLAWGAVACVLGIFYWSSGQARNLAKESWERGAKNEKQIQWISTPQPANPWCWSLHAVSLDPQGGYHVRRAAVSLNARWFSPRQCSVHSETTTAPLVSAHLAAQSGRFLGMPSEVLWLDEFRAPLTQLLEITARDCRASAFLKFARAPFWTQEEGGWTIGDLRYDRKKKLSFAEFRLSEPIQCPVRAPVWDPVLLSVL